MRKHEGNLEKSVPKALWWFTPIELKWTRQTHPTLRQKPSAHIVPLRLKDVEEQRDAVLRGRHQLPDAVLVGWILFGPAWTGDGPIQLGDETTTGSWRKRQQKRTVRQIILKFSGEILHTQHLFKKIWFPNLFSNSTWAQLFIKLKKCKGRSNRYFFHIFEENICCF